MNKLKNVKRLITDKLEKERGTQEIFMLSEGLMILVGCHAIVMGETPSVMRSVYERGAMFDPHTVPVFAHKFVNYPIMISEIWKSFR